MKRELIVVPGDVLGVIEELSPGENTHEHEGYIISTVLGRAEINLLRRTVNCRGLPKKYRIPTKDSVVLGFVSSLRSEVALITIVGLFEQDKLFETSFPLAGLLHVSQVGSNVDSMYDVLGLGDLLKCRVLNSENPYQLTISGPAHTLGVVLASCSRCGAALRLERLSGTLKCPRCGNSEKRRVSKDYLNLSKVI
ncbi:MAG: exosome complex RNA-binding protein Csl4 [Fervidicoccaceae archaeon]